MICFERITLPHGISLDCRLAGRAGQPVMLFLHGFPEAAFVWDELLTHFSLPANGGFLCVAPNMRGYAGSSAPADVKAYRVKELVKDITALKLQLSADAPLAALVAHDWGGAAAWNVANQRPGLMHGLVIINSPHPGTFLRDLKHDPVQQAASQYMNFLIRPDAQELLAADDYRRLWTFFISMGADNGPHAWLNDTVRAQYRAVWQQGLNGALNYYRASPMRPPRPDDPAATSIDLPVEMLRISVPTLVIWGMQDSALPPGLINGLQDYVPVLQLHRIADGTHWLVHEQPALVSSIIGNWIRR
ncbi:MAG: alpha/beta hydrolase [Limnohabitans sp.]|nr:alpha/beta hydrolase [Limnohabitans sp.]